MALSTSSPTADAVSPPLLGSPPPADALPTVQKSSPADADQKSPSESDTRQTPSPKNEVPKNDAARALPENKDHFLSTSSKPTPSSPAIETLDNLDFLVDTLDLNLSLGVQKRCEAILPIWKDCT